MFNQSNQIQVKKWHVKIVSDVTSRSHVIIEREGQVESIALWDTVFQWVCSGYTLLNLANAADFPGYSIHNVYRTHTGFWRHCI